MNITSTSYILTLSCADVRGIVASVSGFISEQDGFIIESAQFGDASTGRFFLRMEFAAGEATPPEDALKKLFYERVGKKFAMDWQIHNVARKPRVAILVSRHGHCLNDLLHRYSTGQLAIEIPVVISNHPDFREVVEWHGIPFYHFPITPTPPSSLKGEDKGGGNGDKRAQESLVAETLERHSVDVVVLARYMQILSPDLCARLAGNAINIHHSFLPSFKGAKPYEQAYMRGVKLIGATAHYVTTDLDEGPIIEQEVERADHTFGPENLAAIGRDVECRVLARALKYHIEHRVLLNGVKTVVFK